jgi:hypothetical protein
MRLGLWFVALTGTQQAALILANAGVARARGQPVPHCVPHQGPQCWAFRAYCGGVWIEVACDT